MDAVRGMLVIHLLWKGPCQKDRSSGATVATLFRKGHEKHMRDTINDGRRLTLRMVAALGSTLLGASWAPFVRAAAQPASQWAGPKLTDMIGSNGFAHSDSDYAMWKKMGLTWGRDAVGPGQPRSASDVMRVDRSGNEGSNLPPIILKNNQNGVNTLLLLAYTSTWNATLPGDSKSAPLDVKPWERYVEAVVSKYHAPPYNVQYFQIWNEAAGKLSGGSEQATFWHGPSHPGARIAGQGPYERAKQDYVDKIHIPAAKIIRAHGAYVVYGGWPDQGGLDTYVDWLEYKSALFNQRMIDWVDYLDTHYLWCDSLDGLYDRYVKPGVVRGLWQTEIGDAYMANPHYLPKYFFEFAVWALDRNWNDPNKYVSMVYHWDGVEPFRLTHPGASGRTYNVSGQSLIVLNQVAPGVLSRFPQKLQFGPDARGFALYSDKQIVIQVAALPGWRTVMVNGLTPPASGRATIQVIDAVTGTLSPATESVLKWDAGALNIRFNVPEHVNEQHAGKETPRHLAYIVVNPQ